jgi:hypothetical protein
VVISALDNGEDAMQASQASAFVAAPHATPLNYTRQPITHALPSAAVATCNPLQHSLVCCS